jgi:hypothetical protein
MAAGTDPGRSERNISTSPKTLRLPIGCAHLSPGGLGRRPQACGAKHAGDWTAGETVEGAVGCPDRARHQGHQGLFAGLFDTGSRRGHRALTRGRKGYVTRATLITTAWPAWRTVRTSWPRRDRKRCRPFSVARLTVRRAGTER